MFFCSVKDATSLYVVYNTFVLEIKLEAIAQAVIPNTSKMCAMPIPLESRPLDRLLAML